MPQCRQNRATDCHSSAAERARAAAVVLEEEFGVPFTLFDAASGRVVSLRRRSKQPEAVRPVPLDPPEVLALANEDRARLTALPGDRYRMVLVLYAQRKPVFV